MRDEADEFFLDAFWLLTTCRPYGMTEGPIPWTAVIQYSDREGLDDIASRVFVQIIQALDGTYLEWQSKKRSK